MLPPLMPLLVASIATLGSVTQTTGQQQPTAQPTPPTFVDRTEVSLGNVDLVALDKAGRPVIDLESDDLVLYVDGNETPISHFALVAPADSQPDAEPGSGVLGPVPQPGASAEPQTIVIYIDNANTLLFDRNAMLTRLVDYVRATLRPPTQAVVATFDTHLRFVTPLTPEPEVIVAALEEIRHTGRRVGANHNLLRSAINQILAAKEDASFRGGPNTPRRYQPTGSLWTMIRANGQHLEDEARRSIESLKLLVRSMAGVEGRKAVIYVSDGLPAVPGLELKLIMNDTAAGFNLFAPTKQFLELVEWASAAEVTFHTIDARGLIPAGGGAAEYRVRVPTSIETTYIHNYQDAIAAVAELSGGVAILGTNELGAGLDRIHAAISTYYSVAFPLELVGEDRAHTIRLELKEPRPVRLRYRRALVERSAATRTADATAAALAFGLTENRLGIRVRIGTPQPLKERGRFAVPITFLVSGPRLLLEPAGNLLRGSVQVFAAAGSPKGGRTPLARDHFTIEVPAGARASLGTLGLKTRIEIEEGSWKLAVGLLDDLGLGTGYTLADITTPRWHR